MYYFFPKRSVYTHLVYSWTHAGTDSQSLIQNGKQHIKQHNVACGKYITEKEKNWLACKHC